ncbi:quinol monooxygenase YgiN [Arthrobacter woluwensis]|uniref:putative quinol monooxygenase n=1 Tax=Arthrobacter woluwensis TaxID=156980 RepID=UPI002783FB07|nr:putative quinol monooxygenase [Arthrobacter woluwensis]MDQ0707770.1 quinol monooxygenase YgiN [Arthrobacter woluwensis]
MSVVVTAIFTPLPGAHEQVVGALAPAISEVHQEPGCELYAIHQAPNGQIVMIEKWSDEELLDRHGAGTAVARLNASLEGLLEAAPVVTRLIPIPAGTAGQGRL